MNGSLASFATNHNRTAPRAWWHLPEGPLQSSWPGQRNTNGHVAALGEPAMAIEVVKAAPSSQAQGRGKGHARLGGQTAKRTRPRRRRLL